MKKFKVGIVGADGLNPAWTAEREEKAKSIITQALDFPKNRNGTVGHAYAWRRITSQKNPIGFASWFDCKPLPERGMEIVLVSGHCPVGQEHPFCVTCGQWLLDKPIFGEVSYLEIHLQKFPSHKVITVFDKGGVDTFAEIIATELDMETEIYPAESQQWGDVQCCFGCEVHHIPSLQLEKLIGKCFCPCHTDKSWQPQLKRIIIKGYNSRNIDIATTIPTPPNGVLYDVEPKGSCKHCGGKGFTAAEAGDAFARQCNYCKGTGNYSGGTRTMQYARKLGKEVHQIIIE